MKMIFMKAFRLFLFLMLGLQASMSTAQEISARILDFQTRQPIPYATIVYAEDKGVITNEEGIFSLTASEEIQQLLISSMGYEDLQVAVSGMPSELFLKPSTIELQEVYLSNKNLSGKEIIAKVKEAVAGNYDLELSQKRFFFRQSDVNTVNHFNMEVDESTIEGIDQKLMNEISRSIPKVTGAYKEVLGDFFGNYEQQKLQLSKAANLYNPSSSERLKELTGEMEQLFKENVKTNSFLKIKSGIIGVKVDAKEFGEDLASNSGEKEETEEEKQKKIAARKEGLRQTVNSQVKNLMGSMFWKENIDFNVFDKSSKYDFTVDGFTQLGGETVYIISFEPKRGADYKGKIYVSTLDYGVYRVDYKNVKPLKKFRLFGVSTAEDVHGGKMIFAKNNQGKYQPKYIEQQRGETFGLDRPLTIIEKNRVVPGRNKQNELDLDLNLSFSQVTTYQFVVYDSAALDRSSFDTVNANGEFDYANFTSYNAEYWEGTNIIEPNAAIQEFTAL